MSESGGHCIATQMIKFPNENQVKSSLRVGKSWKSGGEVIDVDYFVNSPVCYIRKSIEKGDSTVSSPVLGIVWHYVYQNDVFVNEIHFSCCACTAFARQHLLDYIVVDFNCVLHLFY